MPKRAWVLHEKERRRGNRPTPAVRVTKAGLLLNLAAREALGNPTHVTVLIDRRAGVVGLAPSDQDEGNAYSVQTTGQVGCGRFVREERLDQELYDADLDVEGILTFKANRRLA